MNIYDGIDSTFERFSDFERFVSLWRQRVAGLVCPGRLAHIERVAVLARAIARANRLDVRRAYLAGILHDIARDLPDAELLRLAPPESSIDERHPLAVHGRAGRALLEGWGMYDEIVLEAVEDHTTGPRGGNPVAVAVYVADVSEPGRAVNDDIRLLAMRDLEEAYRCALSSKVRYLSGRGIEIHPRTLVAYEGLVNRGCAQDARRVLGSVAVSAMGTNN